MKDTLEIRHEPLGSANLLVVDGEVDLATSPELKAAIDEQLGGGLPVVLDLTEVGFLDSFGIRILLGCAKAAAGSGTPFTVVPSEAVARVFDLTGLTSDVIATAESREAALGAAGPVG